MSKPNTWFSTTKSIVFFNSSLFIKFGKSILLPLIFLRKEKIYPIQANFSGQTYGEKLSIFLNFNKDDMTKEGYGIFNSIESFRINRRENFVIKDEMKIRVKIYYRYLI